MTEIDRNLAAYEKQLDDLVAKHNGQWVVFHDARFAGAFDSFEPAAEFAVKKFGRGPYLIRQVGAPPISLPASVMYHVVNA